MGSQTVICSVKPLPAFRFMYFTAILSGFAWFTFRFLGWRFFQNFWKKCRFAEFQGKSMSSSLKKAQNGFSALVTVYK